MDVVLILFLVGIVYFCIQYHRSWKRENNIPDIKEWKQYNQNNKYDDDDEISIMDRASSGYDNKFFGFHGRRD